MPNWTEKWILFFCVLCFDAPYDCLVVTATTQCTNILKNCFRRNRRFEGNSYMVCAFAVTYGTRTFSHIHQRRTTTRKWNTTEAPNVRKKKEIFLSCACRSWCGFSSLFMTSLRPCNTLGHWTGVCKWMPATIHENMLLHIPFSNTLYTHAQHFLTQKEKEKRAATDFQGVEPICRRQNS